MDEDKFKEKVDDIASDLGRGARVAKDKLAEWSRKVADVWPEVEKSFVRFGRAFAASIGAFAKAFRQTYQGDQEKDKEGEGKEGE